MNGNVLGFQLSFKVLDEQTTCEGPGRNNEWRAASVDREVPIFWGYKKAIGYFHPRRDSWKMMMTNRERKRPRTLQIVSESHGVYILRNGWHEGSGNLDLKLNRRWSKVVP
jgi:hypothetical protein